MHQATYVIIGNSIAAIHAIEGIRELDRDGSIIVISDEKTHVYSRPLISYYLAQKVKEDQILYRPPSFYEKNKIRSFLGKKAVSLDTKAKQVILEDNTRIRYEKLLLATGGAPFVPDIPGKGHEGVFRFRTIEDARCLKRYITDHPVQRAVVLGGGLIGLKATEALLALNIRVSIVELADRILSATFDQTASRLIEKALEHIGCPIMTGNTVKEFLPGPDGRISAAILKDGSRIDCDLAIIAIGVRPRLDLIKGTEIKAKRGILVDHQLETNIKDIFAAGDVIESYDFILNTHRPVAILPNASRQGRIVGRNMAGGNRLYEGCLAMNSVELAGIPTISVGLTDPSVLEDTERRKRIEVLESIEEENTNYKKVVLEDNRIIGVILIGRIDRAGIYTGLIKDKVDISLIKDHLLKDDFGLLSLPKAYRKHLVTGQGIEV